MKYVSMIDSSSEHNRFRGCFYNRANVKELPAELQRILSDYVPLVVNKNQPVDLDKWLEVVR